MDASKEVRRKKARKKLRDACDNVEEVVDEYKDVLTPKQVSLVGACSVHLKKAGDIFEE